MKMLSFPELKEKKGIRWSRQHVKRKIDAGEFPPPAHLGEGTAAWSEEEIDQWLADRIAERDSTGA
jgi:prophage regulatory protein